MILHIIRLKLRKVVRTQKRVVHDQMLTVQHRNGFDRHGGKLYLNQLMRFFSAIKHVLNKLQAELPVWLEYHDVDHVRDVYRMARFIGKAEGLHEHDLKLLLTAAILHDSGFTKGTEKHEERSCEIARSILPAYGYSGEDISRIEKMIMATAIPHKPESLIEKIICDADLDYLGRDDFYERGDRLYRELQYLNVVKDRHSWNLIQEKFLLQHQYFTETAISARHSTKQQHLNTIQEEIRVGSQR